MKRILFIGLACVLCGHLAAQLAKGVVTVMSSAEEELTILLSLHLTHPSPMVFISLTEKK